VVFHCRWYETICQEETNARTNFHKRHPHRGGRRGAPFPLGMEELPSFAKWFQEDVKKAIEEGLLVSQEVKDSSELPSLQARRYKSMYAYGYHF